MEIFKEVLLDSILCGCSLKYCLPSVSLSFTPNPGIYMPISPCSLPNGQLYLSIIILSSPMLSDQFVSLLVIPSVCKGGVSQT